MRRKRYKDEQIAFVLRQAESGTAVEEICRKMSVSGGTFYRRKKQFAAMDVPRSSASTSSRKRERQAQAAGVAAEHADDLRVMP